MKTCRMCGGNEESCGSCGWVEELENEEGRICLSCVQRFMGVPFRMDRTGSSPALGNVKVGVDYKQCGPFPFVLRVLEPTE